MKLPWKQNVTDRHIYAKLGKRVYIRNGVGYGFISDEYLYDNGYLELGFGKSRSGYGDWGGGFTHATTCPLKITLNRNLTIIRVETDSFYNSKSSKEKERVAKSIKLKVGEPLKVVHEDLRLALNRLFEVIPCKHHIGLDLFEHPHMLEHYTDLNRQKLRIRDAECLVAMQI